MNPNSLFYCANKVCRLCASSTSYLRSIDEYYENISYATIIEAICLLQIEKSDGLSQYICFDCEAVVLRAYKLRAICIRNDHNFKMNMTKGFIMPIPTTSQTKMVMEQELSIEDVAIMSVSSENSNDVEDVKDFKESSPVVERPGRKRSRQNSKKMRKHLILIKKEKKEKKKRRTERLISKAADYLDKEETTAKPTNKKILEEPTLKCGEVNCKFAHVPLASLTSLKLHQLLDHSDSLRQPSQHDLLDVKVNENTDLIMRSFGPLIMKDGSKMMFEAPPNDVFCKLCMNNNGKIVNLDDSNDSNKELLLQHVIKTHLEGENVDEKTVDRSTPLRYKFATTKNGNKKITRGTHHLYSRSSKSPSNRVGFQRYICAKNLHHSDKRRCCGVVDAHWATRKLYVVRRCSGK